MDRYLENERDNGRVTRNGDISPLGGYFPTREIGRELALSLSLLCARFRGIALSVWNGPSSGQPIRRKTLYIWRQECLTPDKVAQISRDLRVLGSVLATAFVSALINR